MVGLRRFFSVEKGRSHRPAVLGQKDVASRDFNYLQGIDNDPYGSSTGPLSPLDSPPPMSPGLKSPRALDVDHHLQGIERQFEQLHERFGARPWSSSQSHSDTSSSSAAPRHVDVVEALFSSHRYNINAKWLPITPYNEDVADRNMSRPKDNQTTSHSRAPSVIYKEDVADGKSDHSRTPNRDSKLLGDGRQHCRIIVTTSQEDLQRFPRPPTTLPTAAISRAARTGPDSSLRSQNLAPNLSAEQTDLSQNVTACSSNQHLDIPQGQKAGESPRNVRPISRKNMRDLSINTELAASGRRPAKIEHRANQPPTSHQHLAGPSPSIDEIVNSPLPAATPTSIAPQPTTSYNFEEIMDMFRQAYESTQATSPQPTFETLEDAIVREINSHEAFRRLPVPDSGPPFTPSPTQETFSGDAVAPGRPGSSKGSDKENHLTKLIRKGSLGRKRRNSDGASKALPPTNAPKGHDKIFRRSPDLSGRSRSHTYSQPPTADLIESVQRTQQVRGEKPKEPGSFRGVRPKVLHGRTKSDPKRIPKAQDVSTMPMPNPPPSVRRMRAHSSATVRGSRSDFAQDNDEDSVIELPHVDPPRVQIRSVDENNVTYIFNAQLPLDPDELKNLTGKAFKKNAIGSNTADRVSGKPSVPLTEKRMPLPGGSLNKDQLDSRQTVW
ncbi:hypothetical protein M432DRAFT_208572 [Thermoascus aurantiacus ATCC 26904]